MPASSLTICICRHECAAEYAEQCIGAGAHDQGGVVVVLIVVDCGRGITAVGTSSNGI